ncbi:SMP-30/gluconolactonase/LRE family protein [Rugosimonospora africana]|uniref:Strictosidine synthase n=1 Tax=Rugosimonospora africana TaxID=556532 RepID=A0A8J3QYU9_9ACTN|nr:SMP-30/gluconolactonase/LRE family protein [Rugosimonospora africana]GIH18398.1 strictosidine synthase [Rugosimonospora africana]
MRRPSIHPVSWQAPRAPVRSRQRDSEPPMPAPSLRPIGGRGPEDIAIDAGGTAYTGVADGRLLRLAPDGEVAVIADTGGRPLGVEVDPGGDLVVCDAYRGLLRVDPRRGTVTVLVDKVDGEQLLLCDNAAVAGDGSIYFSDSSRRFTLAHWRADLMEHSGTGRLLRWDPSGTVEVLASGLQFANGVALAADESFVAVAETGAYQISRVWLSGPRAGQRDVLISNLPGFPDNLSTGSDGLLWIALPSPRNRMLDWAHAHNPRLIQAIWAMPDRWQPAPRHTTWVMAVDADGRVVHDLQGQHGYHMVTGVRERDGVLYLGSLIEPSVATVALPVS